MGPIRDQDLFELLTDLKRKTWEDITSNYGASWPVWSSGTGKAEPFHTLDTSTPFSEALWWYTVAFFPHSFIPRSPRPHSRPSHLFSSEISDAGLSVSKSCGKTPPVFWNGKCFCGGLNCKVDFILSNCKFNPIQHVQMVVIPTGTQWSVHFSSNPCLIWLDYNVSIWLMITNYKSLYNGPNAILGLCYQL